MPVHFGLGNRTSIDVARIVWPNGVPQADSYVGVDDAIVAEQRLKGSCPWLFTWDGGDALRDRLPVALAARAPHQRAGHGRHHADGGLGSDPRRSARPRDGVYDVRITAELWETHFFDHVSLMVVDHPADTEVFVDERFSPAAPPALAVARVQRPARRWRARGTTRGAM